MFLTDLDNIEAYTIYIFYSKEDMKSRLEIELIIRSILYNPKSKKDHLFKIQNG